MSEVKLGQIIEDASRRDAVHVAVIPARATHQLYPGQRVSYQDGDASQWGTMVGIVDPFLQGPVMPGQQFWIMITPGTVTDIRHHWSHSEIPEDDQGYTPEGLDYCCPP